MLTLALIATFACLIGLAYFLLLLAACMVAAFVERAFEEVEEPAPPDAKPSEIHDWHRLHRYRRHLEHFRKAHR